MVINRDESLLRAAQMYYVGNETMEAISKELMVSRSTVSRLLKTAREIGLVRISLAPQVSASSRISQVFANEFNVTAHIVPLRRARSDAHRLQAVATLAARRLEEWVTPGSTVGVAWGQTLAAVVKELRPTPVENVTIVQLNGAANPLTSGIAHSGSIIGRMSESFGATFTYFPVPAFFDYAATKEAMWRERSIRRVLAVQQTCDIAVFGVGAARDIKAGSYVYTLGYLDDEDRAELEKMGVVGDVCTVLFRADGTFSDIPLNERATGPNPKELQRIPRRVCIAAGRAKAIPTLGALRSGAVTDLIIDEYTAAEVVAFAEKG